MNTHSEFICGSDGGAFEVTNYSSGNTHPAQWFLDWASGGRTSDAGVTVNGYTALTHCPLWQGVNIIAGDIGQVPIRLVKKEFHDQRSHAAWQLLRVRPNALQRPSVFKETVMQWALIWGNFVGWVIRRGSRPDMIIPLRPDCLRPELIEFERQQVMLYHYYSPTIGKEYTFFSDDVIHIQGLTGDGVWGYPLHEIAQNTIGHGLALEKHGNLSFSNGARPSGVLKHPGKLDPEARSNLRREWNQIHSGVENSGQIAILWEAMEFQAMSMTNIDAQWLEAKKLNRVDTASLLNLPAHKLNALEDSSVRSNLEEQNEVYKQMTLTRWSNRLDEEFRAKLLTDEEWKSDQFQFVFDWDVFLRADIETRAGVAANMVINTILNPNEARRMLGYAPRKGGDVYGNPAINPEPKAGEKPAEPPKEPPKTPQNRLTMADNAHRELLYDRIVHLIERESHNMQRAAKSARNFVEWLDEFYLGHDGGEPTISTLAESIVGTSVRACLSAGVDARGVLSAVNSYAKTRHKQCLEVCSTVNRDELPAAIDSLTNSDATLVAHGLLATALGVEHETNGKAEENHHGS